MPEGAQRVAKSGGIAFLDLRLAERGGGAWGSGIEIDKVELEHADAVVVPELQHIHEVGQEAALRERHGAAVFVERILPLRVRPES